MKIHEYQAKQLLKQYGVPVPEGQVAGTPEEVRSVAATLARRVVIKGQVHSRRARQGGRGQAGIETRTKRKRLEQTCSARRCSLPRRTRI